MNIRSSINSIVKSVFNKAGYSIKKGKGTILDFPDSSMEAGLRRIMDLNINPTKIIDIGAAAGTWTEKALLIWPNAKYELIEPLSERVESLIKLQTLYHNIKFHTAVAGESRGEVGFNVSEDLDGSGIYNSSAENSRKLPVISIDDISSSDDRDVVIKFDTHGYEIPILKGAIKTLDRTSLIIMEVYGFKVSSTCLLFHEMCEYLEKFNFRMVDFMRRPGDHAFWQCDAFFLKKDNPIFTRNSYA
jgi:FkbM family methyltransferase